MIKLDQSSTGAIFIVNNKAQSSRMSSAKRINKAEQIVNSSSKETKINKIGEKSENKLITLQGKPPVSIVTNGKGSSKIA